MAHESIVGVYDTLGQAQDAVRSLDGGGFPIGQALILALDRTSELQSHFLVMVGDIARAAMTTGAWLGGLFGLLVGAAFIWFAGFGSLMVADPLATAFVGGVDRAVIGGAGGGVLGALVGWGVSRDRALKHEQGLQGGQFVVIAHGSADDVARAREILLARSPTTLAQPEAPARGMIAPANRSRHTTPQLRTNGSKGA
jgi:hypothetical protein